MTAFAFICSSRSKLATSFLFAGLVAAPVARAENSSDAAVAQALYDEGRALMSAGREAEACPKFEESQRLDPGSGTLINLALCYEKTSRLASAWSTYLSAAAAVQASGNAEREKGAREYAARLAPNVSRLCIVVPAEARAPNLGVWRDGTEVGAAQWGIELPIDDGEHTIVARAPGFTDWRTKVRVTGPHATVKVSVQRLSPAAQPPIPLVEHGTPGLHWQRTAALVVGATGAVGLTLGGIRRGRSLEEE